MDHINWFPGHMKKATDSIKKSLKLVDLVAEIVDLRIPVSSRNPVIDKIIGSKPHLIILNKKDLADPRENDRWAEEFHKKGYEVLRTDSLHDNVTKELEKAGRRALAEKFKKDREKNIENDRIRMMIVGIPNVGKSTLINRVANKRITRVGNKPGVTRQNQWIKTDGNFELLDTPGILWPKFEEPKTGLHLAFIGSIKDEIMDKQDLAFELLKVLEKQDPKILEERYNIVTEGKTTLEIMEDIAVKRGAIMRGQEIDYERIATIILDEFRKGVMGRITLEKVEDHV
ncbi:MAG: ribosome biogenesis GTPase YlqF [Gallicola sp.]|nr:ribosome biogenesis GTPase YlqF [Gallicola sp.]